MSIVSAEAIATAFRPGFFVDESIGAGPSRYE